MSYIGRTGKLSQRAYNKVSFLATAGQTIKTGLSYVAGFVEVHVNGLLLTDTVDYTATNGNSVTFVLALNVDDEITVVSLKTFAAADMLPLSGGTIAGDLGVVGTVTADGLTVSGPDNVSITQTHTDGNVVTFTQSGTGGDIDWRNANGDALIRAADASRLLVAKNGDISFYEDTGTTPKFFWDASAESLGVGTSSPDTILHVESTTPVLRLTNPQSTSSLGTSMGKIEFETRDSSAVGVIGYIDVVDSNNFGTAFDMTFGTGGSGSATEKMRLDSSGNLLVGKTSSSTTTAGNELRAGGLAAFTRSGSYALNLNRLSDDGDIAVFQKDSITVGSIGTFNSHVYIAASGATAAGLRCQTNNIVTPMTNGSLSDGNVDLGKSNGRFKDLYLSGGVYLGGTAATNKLDDYEEGTWIPTVQGAATNPVINYGSRQGTYTKVGNLVTAFFYFNVGSVTSQGGGLLILAGLPFTVENNNTQQTAAAMTQMQICNSSGTAFGRATPNTASLYLGSYNTSGGFNISNASNMKAGYCVGKITYTAA